MPSFVRGGLTPVLSSFVRDGRPCVWISFVAATVGFIKFALGRFHTDCPHKRIIKVYMERKNMQLELIRFR